MQLMKELPLIVKVNALKIVATIIRIKIAGPDLQL